MKKIKKQKFWDVLQLRNVGLLESLFAMYPILGFYQFGSVPLNLVVLLMLDLVVIMRKGRLRLMGVKEYTLLTFFIIVHEIIWIFVINDVQSYFFNAIIQFVIFLFSVMIIAPSLRWEKLEGAFNWVVSICMIGMTVQFLQVLAGGQVNQIVIPGFDSGALRMEELSNRPRSFFPESGQYAQYMLIPMFIALFKHKHIWSLLIAVTVLMSSSTNGLVLIFVMYAIFLFRGNNKILTKIGLIIGGLALIFLLTRTTYFSESVDKFMMETVRVDTSARLMQGPVVVESMESHEYFLGVPYANAVDYVKGKGLAGQVLIHGTDIVYGVYMTSFWLIILRFGIIGLLFYLAAYFKTAIKFRGLWPLLGCILLMLFSSNAGIGPQFIFHMCFIYAFLAGTQGYNLYTGRRISLQGA